MMVRVNTACAISHHLAVCRAVRAARRCGVLQTYNDIPCVVNKEAESFLVDNGVDPALAYHVAHLFAR